MHSRSLLRGGDALEESNYVTSTVLFLGCANDKLPCLRDAMRSLLPRSGTAGSGHHGGKPKYVANGTRCKVL